ncbi:MAG TPA: preprotein translocase subunit SecG [Brumimicrobium sp.]|nr:preprotein translocase subunit SecG [Brumimicrobium sp.]
MGTFITIVILLACILLILLVLMQNPKGGGFSTDFGSSHQIGGVKQTNALIENATWSLAGIIGVLSIVMTLVYHEPVIDMQDNAQDTEQPMQDDGE